MTRVLVIGCGVIGMTTALRLRESGVDVHIVTREQPAATTSAVAAAIWWPYRVAPFERVAAWANHTWDVFARLADEAPESGVSLVELTYLEAEDGEPPSWLDHRHQPSQLATADVPDGFAMGYRARVPMIDTPIYLAWLRDRLEANGVNIEEREIGHLDELLDEASWLVHCAGLGAREVARDTTMFPIRGQVVRVRTPERVWMVGDTTEPAYVLARADGCIVGGTTDEGVEDLTPSATTTEAILDRCRDLVPELADAEIIETRVGLRPGRPAVRLEVEIRGDTRVLHNYGHGGAGFTLSWGCADEAVALVHG
ncbi:MAG: FAD-dependent oxidoreductase [Acidobacteriota bacterium]